MEFLEHGSEEDRANFEYVYRGKAAEWDDLPPHVKRDIQVGRYHGGELGPDDYDTGHKVVFPLVLSAAAWHMACWVDLVG